MYIGDWLTRRQMLTPDEVALVYTVTGRRITYRQELDFRHPVYIGDTVTAVAEALHVREDKPIVTLSTNCYNQDEKLVIEGRAVVLVDRVMEERHASR